MFKYFFVIALLLCSICRATEPNQLPSTLIINLKIGESTQNKLPRNFRSTLDGCKKDCEGPMPTMQGLKELNIAGSAQFSEMGLKNILEHLNHPLNFYIIDLRQEWHGFLNGEPVSWYGVRNASNRGKTISQIKHEERERLQDLTKQKDIVLSKIVSKDKKGLELPEVISMPFTAKTSFTEEILAAKYGVGYIRIPVTDALSPSSEMVDRFLEFVKNLPKNSSLYFHCAAGVGRTTSFMAMYDMMKNAKNVSFEDILKRQYLIGGSNLAKFGSETSWKHSYAVERYQFLKDFYNYTLLNSDGFKTSWSQYVSKNNLKH